MKKKHDFPEKDFKKLLVLAVAEDLGCGDITTNATVPKSAQSTAVLIAKESGIIAGLPVIPLIFRHLRIRAKLKPMIYEGQKVKKGTRFYQISAGTRSILKTERILLNFIQRMSGIASSSHRLQNLLKNSSTKILDTRKTLPGFRTLDKYAVKTGGSYNHRMGLYDQVLIKDNHIQACGSVRSAVEKARLSCGKKMIIEAEVSSLSQLKSLLSSDVNRIMLDNMTIPQMKAAVSLVKNISPKIKLEASGNMNDQKILSISKLGLDFISVGSLTHSIKALDISLKFI